MFHRLYICFMCFNMRNFSEIEHKTYNNVIKVLESYSGNNMTEETGVSICILLNITV